MPLKGYLSVFSTTQLLNLINLSKKTGTLRIFEGIETNQLLTLGDGETKIPKLEAGQLQAEVFFNQGKLLYATMHNRSGDLISVLQKAGRLNDEQARAMREMGRNQSDKALALRLINANYVTKQNVVQSIQKHTLDVMFDLMGWNREPFEFDETAPPPNDKIVVPIPLENVIIEGSRRLYDQKRLEEELPNLDFALKFREAPGEKFKEIKLSTAEWRVVGFVNPKNSIRQIAKACSMTDTEIRRVVHALREAGLVELVKPQNLMQKQEKKPATTGLRSTSKRPQTAGPDRATVMRLMDKIMQL
jgi:hypothetical protein